MARQGRYNEFVPIPPSTPPPQAPPPFMDVSTFLQKAILPPWIETSVVQELDDSYLRAASELEEFDSWSKEAVQALAAMTALVEERGASNLLQIIETVDSGARKLAASLAGFPKRQEIVVCMLEAYKDILRRLVKLRDADLIRASSAATYALIQSWNTHGEDGRLGSAM